MILSLEILQPYVGGQLEVQNALDGYLYRGEIQSVELDDMTLTLQLAWMAQGEGFPPMPLRWVDSPRKAFSAHLGIYAASNIGPGTTGSDRLCLMSIDGRETAILYPPDGSRISQPEPSP